MSIVFDNIVFNLQRTGGISRFWSKIIEPYCGADHVAFIEHSGGSQNLYRNNMSVDPRVPDHRLPTQIARYVNFSRKFFNDDFVFHSSYFRVNVTPGCVNLTTVHDLIYEKFVKGVGARLHLKQKASALHKSDCIVCVSENTRKDLLEYYPFCVNKRVVVIPNGVSVFHENKINHALFQRAGLDNTEAYFLYVGHRGRCKGFNLVHDVIDILGRELLCVVVGDPFSKNEIRTIHDHGHETKILNVGKVSDSELNVLYSQARFFFFPSLYEGFGIPPLEAMSAGCPVLASNCSSVPEVVGAAGVFFDPLNLPSLTKGLLRVLQSDVRAELIALGIEHAKKFSWESIIARYSFLYSDLLGKSTQP